MGEYKRGFKSWCEKMAAGLRRDLGLHPHAGLDPHRLAEHLGVVVICPKDLKTLDPEHCNQLLQDDPESWSAVTLAMPEGTLIVRNSTSSIARQNNDLMHELSHLILKHEPKDMMRSSDGHMILDNYDKAQELEADWLASALLVPRDALIAVYAKSANLADAAAHFGVSKQLITMRLQLTGINRQLVSRTNAS